MAGLRGGDERAAPKRTARRHLCPTSPTASVLRGVGDRHGALALAGRRVAHVVAIAHAAGGAPGTAVAARLAERVVEHRRCGAEHAPRALAARDDPGMAHPAGAAVVLGAAAGLALL